MPSKMETDHTSQTEQTRFVMEDPEARRARLKAMREQAEGVSQSAPIANNSAPKLVNPFEDPAPTSNAHTPRFNYYSDPTAGFLHKRKETPTPVAMSPSRNPYPQGHWKPDYHPPAPIPPPRSFQVGAFGSPIPMFNPHQQGPLPPALEPQQQYGDGTWPSKRFHYGTGRGGRGSGPGRGGFGRNEGNQARGRGGGQGGRGGRGQGDTGPVSARDSPDLFYHKSMVEDPWRHL
ncbi:uncharacterized protein [Physcomitrium patens]|uniref:Uncharacterized protein n=3 Tax=Physcomitrium patens TaxID=3218 RepID=A9SP31_PHYPA